MNHRERTVSRTTTTKPLQIKGCTHASHDRERTVSAQRERRSRYPLTLIFHRERPFHLQDFFRSRSRPLAPLKGGLGHPTNKEHDMQTPPQGGARSTPAPLPTLEKTRGGGR